MCIYRNHQGTDVKLVCTDVTREWIIRSHGVHLKMYTKYLKYYKIDTNLNDFFLLLV
jgi:hypothetical protein